MPLIWQRRWKSLQPQTRQASLPVIIISMRSLFPVQDSFVSQSTGQVSVKLREHGFVEMCEVSKRGFGRGTHLPLTLEDCTRQASACGACLWSTMISSVWLHKVIVSLQDFTCPYLVSLSTNINHELTSFIIKFLFLFWLTTSSGLGRWAG